MKFQRPGLPLMKVNWKTQLGSTAKWASSYVPCDVVVSAQSLAQVVENKRLLAGVKSLPGLRKTGTVLALWGREHSRHPASTSKSCSVHHSDESAL